ncbi:hypothetical protein GCM10009762_23050 [Dermacoccus barathri]|uniref:Uracil-DNA glycosylase n=1 Tax=Dermacoccus barathri TaxID=322601 RepID=A0ABN2C0F3_9MICO
MSTSPTLARIETETLPTPAWDQLLRHLDALSCTTCAARSQLDAACGNEGEDPAHHRLVDAERCAVRGAR